jgi:hypothetical protein
MKRSKKYQVGGDTDFFNQLVDQYAQQYQSQESDPQTPQYEDVPQTDEDNTDYQDLQERYDNLQNQFEELSSKINGFTNQTFQDDSFLNFLFSESDDKRPLDFSHESNDVPEGYSASKTSGLNPNLLHTNTDIFGKYNVTNLGAWGDKAHQARVSDHNTGDAQDYGVNDPETAQNVVAELQRNPKTKYIIYNKKIWNPSISDEWRPYTGSNPHTDHVHASFNRQYGGPTISGEATHEGLNDPCYAQFGQLQMNLPQQYNVIRGLDNGTPVRVEDELGQSAVLHGKNHKKYFFGKVKETML